MVKDNNARSSSGCCSEDLVEIRGNCPLCHNQGEAVGKITVEHLVAAENRKAVVGDKYRICLNEECDVVYYDVESGAKFLKDQIKVPVWFKKDADPKYACYCTKVTEEQVVEAVLKHGAKTVQEVNAVTGAMKNSNCKENNPMGVCCHKIIEEVIRKQGRKQ